MKSITLASLLLSLALSTSAAPLSPRADTHEIRIQLKNGAKITSIMHQYKHPNYSADSSSVMASVSKDDAIGTAAEKKKYYFTERLGGWGDKAEGVLPPLGAAEYKGVKGQRVDTYLYLEAGGKKMRCGIHRTFAKVGDSQTLLNKDTAQKKAEAFIIYDKPAVWDPALGNVEGKGVEVKDGNVNDGKEVTMKCTAWAE